MAAAPLPVVTGTRAVQALTKAGLVVDRVVGSHHVLRYPGEPARASGRDLKPGTLRRIIRQAGLTIEEFNNLL
jgi:predicted RNA binding protein YcfA (HicA-like mRNA interferase family)